MITEDTMRKSAKKHVRKAIRKAVKKHRFRKVIKKKVVRRAANRRSKTPKQKIRRIRRVPKKILFRPLPSVATSKTAAEPTASYAPSDDRIPACYGENKLVLLVRDPWWLYAYWEVTKARQEEMIQQIKNTGHREWKTVLRVYDVTEVSLEKARSFFDIELNVYTDNWYIDVGSPDREWMAQVGLLTPSGRFFVLVSSNRVRTPSFGVSSVLDEEWMMPDDVYYRLIGMSGLSGQRGSMDIRKILEKYLKRLESSASIPQVSRKS